jgi:hypothetical protein
MCLLEGAVWGVGSPSRKAGATHVGNFLLCRAPCCYTVYNGTGVVNCVETVPVRPLYCINRALPGTALHNLIGSSSRRPIIKLGTARTGTTARSTEHSKPRFYCR